MDDGKAAELRSNNIRKVDDVSHRARAEVAIDRLEVAGENELGLAVVFDLEGGQTKKRPRVGPQQVNQAQRFGLVPRNTGAKLDGPGGLLELISKLDIETSEQIGN